MEKNNNRTHQSSLSPLQHLDFTATSIISKWGNSQGIRLPKSVIDILNLNVNDKLELRIIDNGIFVKKILPHKKYKTLKERMEDYYQCSFEQIETIETKEVDWNSPIGDEFW